ncbi:MAG: AI-2E family transporter [Candidatus Pacebacteria bacterium]|nr:AI-2E family transporter [Candidatus Paceibacterota bacterium]
MFNNDSKNVVVNIGTGTIIKTLLFILLFVVLYFFRDLVLIIITAVVLASSIEPITKWLMRYKIPRVLAVILIYIAFFSFCIGIFVIFMPVVLDETFSFIGMLPAYINAIESWNPISHSGFLSPTALEGISSGFSVSEVVVGLREIITNTFSSFWQTINQVFGGLFSFILILVFSFYFAVQELGIINFLKIITPLKHESYIIDLWRRSQLKIGLWMQGQLLLALLIGVFVYLGLMVLGIKYALLLALLSAFAELIPLFGPILAAIPAILIAFADGGTTMGLMVLGFFVIIQQFENHLIYPLVVKKVVGVPPLMVIIALMVGAKLAGFLGLLIAVPIAAILMEFVNDIEKNKKRQLAEES